MEFIGKADCYDYITAFPITCQGVVGILSAFSVEIQRKTDIVVGMNEDETRKEISKRLVDLRNKKGASVGIGRDSSKFPQSTMWEWEANAPKQLTRLKMLAEWYGVSADYIITLIDTPLPIQRKQLPSATLSIREESATYEVDTVQELIWIMRNLPEEKQKAIVEIAKVVGGL